MNKAELQRQLSTFQTLHVMEQAEMEQTLRDLATALHEEGKARDKWSRMTGQRDAIACAHAREAARTERMSLHAMEHLRHQFDLAHQLATVYAADHERASGRCDALKTDAASAQNKVRTLEDGITDIRRAITRERDRLDAIQLDDLWLGRQAHEGKLR